MTVKQLIDMSCAYAGISKADLARNVGWSPQTLSNRINTGKFSMEDWEKLGKAMGATIKVVVEFSDGKRIE